MKGCKAVLGLRFDAGLTVQQQHHHVHATTLARYVQRCDVVLVGGVWLGLEDDCGWGWKTIVVGVGLRGVGCGVVWCSVVWCGGVGWGGV